MWSIPLTEVFRRPTDHLPELLLLLVSAALGSVVFGIVCLKAHLASKHSRRRTAIVMVLGDIGRSPRMMYHADSFAKHDWQTEIVAYYDTPPIPSLQESPYAHPHPIANPPKLLLKLPWVARAPLRIVYQTLSVLYICLIGIPYHCEYLVVQNPPSIPTLLLAQIIARATGTKLIVDWHNTGYSILAMRVGPHSPLVKIAAWFERTFGQQANTHLFVTYALKDYLGKEWDLQGKLAVLHDRPPPHFRPTGPMSAHELLYRLESLIDPPLPSWLSHPSSQTTLTHIPSDNIVAFRPDRPAVLVSSTSWTADEDFSLLITALDAYQSARSSGRPLPKLVVLITGLGGMRAAFQKIVEQREKGTWTDICVRCVFVPARDYPTLLGCADLGVSLHTSSSGRDLPMKVVDMFGCGVPVLAKEFGCIGELVKDRQNGRVFRTAEELGEMIQDLLSGFPNGQQLRELKAYFQKPAPRSRRSTPEVNQASEDEWTTWEENWNRVMYRGILASGFALPSR